jgi:hypothetical protein
MDRHRHSDLFRRDYRLGLFNRPRAGTSWILIDREPEGGTLLVARGCLSVAAYAIGRQTVIYAFIGVIPSFPHRCGERCLCEKFAHGPAKSIVQSVLSCTEKYRKGGV